MNIPVVAGRKFRDTDTAASPRDAIVNRTFVRTYLGNANPIGKTLRTVAEPNYPAASYENIGVIPDTKYAFVTIPADDLRARHAASATAALDRDYGFSSLAPAAVKSALVCKRCCLWLPCAVQPRCCSD